MKLRHFLAVGGLVLCSTSIFAMQTVLAFKYGSGMKTAVAIVSAESWVNDAREAQTQAEIADPLLHIRSADGVLSGTSYSGLQAGDVLAPSKTCPGCQPPLFVFREGRVLKSTGGYGDALTHCTAATSDHCFHMLGITMTTVELETGARARYALKSTPGIFHKLFPFPPSRLHADSAVPSWGATLIPVATALHLAELAEQRRLDVERSLRLEMARFNEAVRLAQEQALGLVRSGQPGQERSCASPAGLAQPKGTPIGQFQVACDLDWPVLPNQLAATVEVRDFLVNGWSIVDQNLIFDPDTGRLHAYLNLKRKR